MQPLAIKAIQILDYYLAFDRSQKRKMQATLVFIGFTSLEEFFLISLFKDKCIRNHVKHDV